MYSYRIASFNLCKFSTNTNKDLDMVAQIIIDNQVDILAVQEIFSEQAGKNLLLKLGPRWDGRWDTPNSRSSSAAEGYAFFWNTDRIGLSKRKNGTEFEPVIHNQYPHKDGGSLIRNPYYGRFVLKANEMTEIRLINTHIMFSQSRGVNESEDHDSSIEHMGDVSLRKREFEILASKILPKLDDKAYDYQWNEVDGICRRPYTILLGDYNLNLRESGARDAFIEQPLIIIKEANSEKHIVTIQTDLTTLKAKTLENPQIDGYRNNFDHFTYDSNRPMRVKSWAVDAPNDSRYYSGNYEQYKENVSDHLMIILEMELI